MTSGKSRSQINAEQWFALHRPVLLAIRSAMPRSVTPAEIATMTKFPVAAVLQSLRFLLRARPHHIELDSEASEFKVKGIEAMKKRKRRIKAASLPARER